MKYVIETTTGGNITVVPDPDEQGRPERNRFFLEVRVETGEGDIMVNLLLDNEKRNELVRAMDMALGNGSMSFPSFVTHPPGVRG